MRNGDDNRPANLPRGAPDTLKQFVACEVDSGSLDLTDTAWLNELPMVAGATITVKPGATSSRATITLDAEYMPAFDLEVSIVDGQLVANIPGTVGEALNGPIKEWTDKVNATFRRNGKQMRDFHVDGTTITLRKEVIPPAASTPAAAATAPVTSVVGGGAVEPESEPAEQKKPWGCAAWIAGAIAAVAVIIGLVVASNGGDGDDAITSGQGGTAAPATTSSTTSTTSTTIAEVGQVPPPPDPEPETRVCGVLPDGDFAVDSFFDVFTELATDGGGCVPGPDSYTTGGCDPLFLPCATSPSPLFFVPGGNPGYDHTRSVPDAITEEEGRSLAEFASYIRLFLGDEEADATLRIASDCGGDILTGEVPVTNGAINILDQPLLQFGPCVVSDAQVIVNGFTAEETFARELAAALGLAYVVGPDEPDPELPQGLDSFVASNPAFIVPDGWAAASRTVTQTLGAEPFDDDCFWFFPPSDVRTETLIRVLDGCAINENFWVFAAGTTNVEVTFSEVDTIVGHGAAFTNPAGEIAPTEVDIWIEAFDNAPSLDPIFPCGPGDVGFTACPPGAPPFDSGAFVTVSAAMLGTIPIDSDGADRLHMIDFGPSGGPSYTVSQDADGWTVSSSAGDTRARGILRDNSLTLLAPHDELPDGELSYQLSTDVDGELVTQPILPIVGLIPTPGGPITEDLITEDPPPEEPPGEVAESIEDFYAQLSASISTGDLEFALERLDPTVIEAYPTECPAALESFVDPDFLVVPIAEGETGPWPWELPDGRLFDIPDATAVTITVSGRGQTGAESEAHLTTIDGHRRWFTFCA